MRLSILFLIWVLLSVATAFSQDNFSNSPPKRAHHGLVYHEESKTILLTAGSTPLNGGESYALFNDLWQFNGREWKQIGKAGDERSGISMAFDSKRKKLFSFGGYRGPSLGDLRVMENGDWKTLANDTAMKAAEPGFVYDRHRDKLIAFGGSAKRGATNNITWEWDGESWKKFGGEGPEGRQAFAMVYASKQRKTMVFGGGDGAGKIFGDELWSFDGKRWQKTLSNGTGPGPRIAPGYAYDDKRGLLIIFGGISNGVLKGDTWAWDGKKWKLLAETGPSARTMGYLAYDKARDRIVLFGGRMGWPNDANDTWEWDGKGWREIK
jgi:hypothetical protein